MYKVLRAEFRSLDINHKPTPQPRFNAKKISKPILGIFFTNIWNVLVEKEYGKFLQIYVTCWLIPRESGGFHYLHLHHQKEIGGQLTLGLVCSLVEEVVMYSKTENDVSIRIEIPGSHHLHHPKEIAGQLTFGLSSTSCLYLCNLFLHTFSLCAQILA